MEQFLKKPYEISLWNDILYYAAKELKQVTVEEENYVAGKYYSKVKDYDFGKLCYLDNDPYDSTKVYYTFSSNSNAWKKETANISELDNQGPGKDKYFARTQFYKEIKLCTIGSDTMSSPIRAVKPKLVSKVNGENTFTFTMYSQYWDENTQQLEWNPFMMYLTNERKLKLKYGKDKEGKDKWYDFIIKNISEDSSSKAFTYTCKDLFVNELSKTGFELEFDNELGNNMGNQQFLAEKILEGSDWRFKTNSETVSQYLEEPLYEIVLEQDKGIKVLYGPKNYNYNITAKKGHKIYVFYSSFEYNEKNEFKIKNKPFFLYDPSQKYLADDKNVIIEYDKIDAPNGTLNCTIEGSFTEPYTFFDKKRGKRLIKSQKTYFDPKLKRTVNVYNDGAVYGYKVSDYISPISVQSYVANQNGFTNTSGWYKGKVSNETFPDLGVKAIPELTKSNFDNYIGHSYLKFVPQVSKQVLMNSGLTSNRTSIGGFTKGEKYKFSIQAYSNPQIVYEESYEKGLSHSDIKVFIGEYTFKDNIYTKIEYIPTKVDKDNFSTKINEGLYFLKDGSYIEVKTSDDYNINKKYFIRSEFGLFKLDQLSIEKEDGNNFETRVATATCQYSISEEEYKDKKIGIFIIANSTNPIYIKDMQFYPLKYDANNEVVEPGKMINATVKEEWRYYSANAIYTSEKDLEFLYKGAENSAYLPFYNTSGKPQEAFEKVRSITAKESNRFNLLQKLCELFENWIEFEIEHESNGQIKIDSEYKQKKWVSYRKYTGQDNYVGFKYGINLKSIKRTLDSNSTISKIIVKNNSNEFAPHGYCSIARAEENETGENAIYNFDYYVGQKLIEFTTLNNDLYFQPNNSQGYLGYYKSLKVLNNQSQEKIEELANLKIDRAKYDSLCQTYKTSTQSAEQEKADLENRFEVLTGMRLIDAIPEYQIYNSKTHKPTGASDKWWEKKDNQWYFYTQSDDKSYVKIETNPETAAGKTVFARLKWWDNTEAQKTYQSISTCKAVINDHSKIYEKQKELQDAAIIQQLELEGALETIRGEKIEINKKFYDKYSRFIQEGSWISEDYMDDNLYYMDALSTLYTSSRPKVTYTIEVIELSQLPGYECFDFKLGDKTYVEDKEFFGWAYDGTDRMYREEVIVTEITRELDNPEADKLKVQNYKNQFDDLFQRVVATTQQVQFSTGEYKRGAAIVQAGGIISASALQNSFANNAITLQNIKDQSVVIGDDGITTTNLSRPSEIVRITSGGIFLSENGGESWTAGITAHGINASCITTGQLNASEVNITMGQEIAFRWDKLGISAYRRDETGISPGVFTRFDQFGIYGIDGETNFDALEGNASRQEAMERIKQHSSFGLTWDGFWLRSNGTNGYVSISSDSDFEVVRYKNEEKTEKTSIIQIGRLQKNNEDYYGLCIKDIEGNTMLEANQDGALWLRKILSVQTSDEGKLVQIGTLGLEDSSYMPTENENIYNGAPKVIDANRKFKVYEDGHVEARDIELNGSGVFKGTITATGGEIGGLTVEEWKEMTYSVRVESELGFVLKNETSVNLTATIYKGTEEYFGYEVTKDSIRDENKTYYKKDYSSGKFIEFKYDFEETSIYYEKIHNILYRWFEVVNGEKFFEENGNQKEFAAKMGAGKATATYGCDVILEEVGVNE